jgi:heme exporter protein A
MSIDDLTRASPAPPNQPRPTISLRAVSRLFDGMPAISQVTLEVSAGETVWLRGSNGSGKSTLLRVIATALSATYGSGTVLGHDLLTGRPQIRRGSDFLGHSSRLYEDLTAVENLRFVCRMHELDHDRITPALARVGLDEVAHIRTGSFSQGMRQRLALARCIIRRPDLILLDEPYAGLDADSRTVVNDLLDETSRRGGTVVLASHETPPLTLVDRSITLDGGRVLPVAGVTLDGMPVSGAHDAGTHDSRAHDPGTHVTGTHVTGTVRS